MENLLKTRDGGAMWFHDNGSADWHRLVVPVAQWRPLGSRIVAACEAPDQSLCPGGCQG
jgi:hypothetical protein